MSLSSKTVDQTIPDGIDLTPKERLAILHIAYLTIAADRQLSPEEIAAFALLAGRLMGKPMSPAEAQGMLSGFPTATLPRDELKAKLESLARALRKSPTYVQEGDPDAAADTKAGATTTVPGPRHIAYRVAYALAICDLATSDAEFEFDLQLLDALELSTQEGEALCADVLNAMSDEN